MADGLIGVAVNSLHSPTMPQVLEPVLYRQHGRVQWAVKTPRRCRATLRPGTLGEGKPAPCIVCAEGAGVSFDSHYRCAWLTYRPVGVSVGCCQSADKSGLEPETSSLTGRRSAELSYVSLWPVWGATGKAYVVP